MGALNGPAGMLVLALLGGGDAGGPADRPPAPERAEDPTAGLARVRALYLAAVADETAIDRGLAEIERVRAEAGGALPERERVTLEAYRGALITLRAKHAVWPPTRLRHLRRGLEVLDAVVAAHPDEAEARYLRLMSCFYLPPILGRRESVREDFAALARILPDGRGGYPDEVYRVIAAFVLQEGELDAAQRDRLRRALGATDG